MIYPKEIKVTLKDENRKLVFKEMEHQEFQASPDDPVVRSHICMAKKSFDGEEPECRVSITFDL